MAYDWAQLAFVEKWRRHAVRGLLVGMYRPEGRTFFDLRLRPGEGGAGSLPGAVELHLLDAGDLIREKRIALLASLTVVVRVIAAPAANPLRATPERGRAGRRLEPGAPLSGKVVREEDGTALVDVGLPVVVQLPDGGGVAQPGQSVDLVVAETPRGFIVV